MIEDGKIRAQEVQIELDTDYRSREPFNIRFLTSALTQRATHEWFIRGQVGDVDDIKKELSELGEDPNEWMVAIGILDQLPEGFLIPETYKGIRVGIWVLDQPIEEQSAS